MLVLTNQTKCVVSMEKTKGSMYKQFFYMTELKIHSFIHSIFFLQAMKSTIIKKRKKATSPVSLMLYSIRHLISLRIPVSDSILSSSLCLHCLPGTAALHIPVGYENNILAQPISIMYTKICKCTDIDIEVSTSPS